MTTDAHAAQIQIQDLQLVQIVDRALAEATEKSGAHLVCRPGCTQCCHGAFAINALDAFRLRTGMAALKSAQPAIAAQVEARALAYLAQFAEDFPGDPISGVLGESDEAQAAFEDFASEAACPALDPQTGLCDLYSARPMTCRVFGPPVRSGEEGGLAVCELCFTTASPEEIAACEMPVPYEQEQEILDSFDDTASTIVAFCLVPSKT
jgi:Fe-S-cluster containining protein